MLSRTAVRRLGVAAWPRSSRAYVPCLRHYCMRPYAKVVAKHKYLGDTCSGKWCGEELHTYPQPLETLVLTESRASQCGFRYPGSHPFLDAPPKLAALPYIEEADRRGRIYDRMNNSYLFNLNEQWVLDARHRGNKFRFANHSPKPNCKVRVFV
eukprot:353358-Chlamydomonas_euryale.AAC.1